VVSLALAASRKTLQASDDLKTGNWSPRGFSGSELAGKHLGTIGHGHIGKLVEQKATALGMTASYVDSKSSPEDTDRLIAGSDYLVLCLPLNDTTRNMIDARRLALMRPTSYLINVARGAIVDQQALTDVLKSHKIAGAALDVFDGEPQTGKPSSEIVSLASMQNVIATRHIGATTAEADTRLGDEIITNIMACLDGHAINVVNH
jgi:phosphoglycerate dehydrogenase-like enzyme